MVGGPLRFYKKGDGKTYYVSEDVEQELTTGGSVTPGDIASAVEAYLIENPPQSSGGLSQAQILARGYLKC
jgi:hypothetical protein